MSPARGLENNILKAGYCQKKWMTWPAAQIMVCVELNGADLRPYSLWL
jgi:hypothetical protein